MEMQATPQTDWRTSRPRDPLNADPILIVGRDAKYCRDLADSVAGTGYSALWTSDSIAAARLVASTRFALVVADETMVPEVSHRDPTLPLLRLADGVGGRAVVRRCGADAVARPREPRALLARIWLLARSRAR
jgi:DNA-binding response OmpR family regulator